MPHRILDPLDRASEVLFGVIMVLTFTGSISVAEGGRAELRTILAAAIGCNLAWGLVDAAMYLMAVFINRARGQTAAEPPAGVILTTKDVAGAAGIFLLVFASTFPVLIPFLVITDTAIALRVSNAVAVVMLFLTGWSVGRHAGRSGWRAGLLMVGVGIVLIAITIALGG